MDTSELESIRHDFKNVVTALRSGCALIESRLQPAAEPEVRELLDEMRAELEKSQALVARLREFELLLEKSAE
jgi:hypothetical protein